MLDCSVAAVDNRSTFHSFQSYSLFLMRPLFSVHPWSLWKTQHVTTWGFFWLIMHHHPVSHLPNLCAKVYSLSLWGSFWLANMWRLTFLYLRKPKQWWVQQLSLEPSWTAVVDLVAQVSFQCNIRYESFVTREEIAKERSFSPLTASHN